MICNKCKGEAVIKIEGIKVFCDECKGTGKIFAEQIDLKNVAHHPPHYNKGTIECIEAIKSAIIGLNPNEAFYTGNVIKYMWRWKEKGQIKDLQKAKTYIDMLIEDLRKE